MTTQNIFDLVDTWNDGATTFTAVKMNVTDTSSAAASLLMDLLVNSVSAFNVSKGGSLKLGLNASGTNVAASAVTISASRGTGNAAGGSIIFQVAPAGGSGATQNTLVNYVAINPTKGGGAATGNAATLEFVFDRNVAAQTGFGVPYSGQIFIYNQGVPAARILSGRIELNPTAFFSWNSGADFLGSTDLILLRDAANTLALRNGTAAQEMRVYETTTGTIYKAILGNRQLIKIAGAAFDNGAGASAGTLTNAPAVGNPTKWIPIDDNGTTRHIPAW